MSAVESSLAGQVAIITGAGKGIGRALADRLSAEGVQLGLMARTKSEIDDACAAAQANGVRAIGGAFDVSDRGGVEDFVAEVQRNLGPVDLLINNAARSASWSGEKFWEVDPDGWWSRIETNLRGPMLFARAVLPAMVARGSGRIVAMNSLAGAMPLPMTDGAYPVSKSALFRLTDQLASQLVDTGVVALDLSPGIVRTQANDNPAIPASAWTPIERICDLVVAVAQGRLDGYHGRFVHAVDDLDEMVARVDECVANDGRVLRMRKAWPEDPRA
jgi:NAD(P)-dependent dehydrogenase (short-subunit alcohol dehydrogenase family)